MSKSQRPAGGGAGGVGPTTASSREGQQLTHANACWMSSHAAVLDDHLPRPGHTWRWGDTGLSRSILCDLRNRSLIEQREDGWETTQRAWRALERYTASQDDRDEAVSQQELEAYVEEARGKQ